tara:strand:+ start:221 stop:487 length:267 start_codon:yes stop_codon:yes gene_type:complete
MTDWKSFANRVTTLRQRLKPIELVPSASFTLEVINKATSIATPGTLCNAATVAQCSELILQRCDITCVLAKEVIHLVEVFLVRLGMVL